MDDLINRQAALALAKDIIVPTKDGEVYRHRCIDPEQIRGLPSAQPTIYGYNVEHLKLIARILQKENVPPERVVEALTDIGRIVAIINDEFEEALRRELNNVRFDRETSGN